MELPVRKENMLEAKEEAADSIKVIILPMPGIL